MSKRTANSIHLVQLANFFAHRFLASNNQRARIATTFRRFLATRPTNQQPNMPRFYADSRDPATLIAIYQEPQPNRTILLHLVWTDEYHPNPRYDEEYRKLRQEKYGRTTDVETIGLEEQYTWFPLTFAGPQPYYSAIHLPAILPNTNTIYPRTWNHLLNTRPSASASYEEAYPITYEGTRQDAEAHRP